MLHQQLPRRAAPLLRLRRRRTLPALCKSGIAEHTNGSRDRRPAPPMGARRRAAYPPAAGLGSCHCSCGRRAARSGARSGAGAGRQRQRLQPPRERLRPCPAEASLAAKPGPRPSRARRGPGCSSPWAACTGCYARATTRSGWAPAPRCTWRPCWSTCRPRSWSWRATRRGTTRRRASSRGTCSWPSATTRSSTSFWAASPSRRAASCPTSRPCCCPRRRRAPRSEAQPRAPAGPALPCPAPPRAPCPGPAAGKSGWNSARPAPSSRRPGPARLSAAARTLGPAAGPGPTPAPLSLPSGRSALALPPSRRPCPPRVDFFHHELGKGNPFCTVEAPDCGRASSLPSPVLGRLVFSIPAQ